MQITRVHFTLSHLMRMLGMNMQERIRLTYTAVEDQVPRFWTVLMELCSLLIDSKAVNSSRKEKEMRRTFL